MSGAPNDVKRAAEIELAGLDSLIADELAYLAQLRQRRDGVLLRLGRVVDLDARGCGEGRG